MKQTKFVLNVRGIRLKLRPVEAVALIRQCYAKREMQVARIRELFEKTRVELPEQSLFLQVSETTKDELQDLIGKLDALDKEGG